MTEKKKQYQIIKISTFLCKTKQNDFVPYDLNDLKSLSEARTAQ